jgi:SAM-dependent methyltransferase
MLGVNAAEAIERLREDPRFAELVRDSYLGEDLQESAERFSASAEFADVLNLAGSRLPGGAVLDLGAGNGIASFAFARSGARFILAIEPDLSTTVGLGALRPLVDGMAVEVVCATGEAIPLRSGAVDLVYARQVLHHAADLRQLVSECARVLKPGGLLLACREHVVDDERQLEEFLRRHPVHQLAGGENAFRLTEYLGAIEGCGLRIDRILRPWDSIINAFPLVRTHEELQREPSTILTRRLGGFGTLISRVPSVQAVVRAYLNRRGEPGRLYTFVATKP